MERIHQDQPGRFNQRPGRKQIPDALTGLIFHPPIDLPERPVRIPFEVERIEGSYSGVMGLPLYETAMLLARLALPERRLD